MSSFNTVRNGTATWVLAIGLVAGLVCSFVVLLNWFSGAAFAHGSRGITVAVVSTLIIVGFTIDSEVRLTRRVIRNRQ